MQHFVKEFKRKHRMDLTTRCAFGTVIVVSDDPKQTSLPQATNCLRTCEADSIDVNARLG